MAENYESMCVEHVQDAHLSRTLAPLAIPGHCAVCGQDARAVAKLHAVARATLTAAKKRFDHSGFIPDEEQLAKAVTFAVIVEAVLTAAVDEDFRSDVAAKVVALVHSDRVWYETYDEDGEAGTYFSWRDFEHRVKHQSRLLLPPNAERPRTPPEENYVLARSMADYVSKHEAFIRRLSPGTQLYRARTGRNIRELERQVRDQPKKEMGPPPADTASAARLSAAGMPMFYTALTPETACEEVTSHSPYNECVVATFTVNQPLRVLDLTATPEPLSLFDEAYASSAGVLRDFKYYRDRMTDAFAADESQAIEYLPSQLLTEAFRWWTVPPIHGIAYPSTARSGGENIALFFEDWEWIEEVGKQFDRFGSPSKPNSSTFDEFEERSVFTVDATSVSRYEVKKTVSAARVHPQDWA